MSDLEKIKNLQCEFLTKILFEISRVDTYVSEMIAIQQCITPNDLVKRTKILKPLLVKDLKSKLDDLEGIVKKYYPDFVKKNPAYFSDLEVLRKLRNSLGHNTLAYYGDDPLTKTGGKLYLNHPLIKKQRTLTLQEMRNSMKKMDSVVILTVNLHRLVQNARLTI